MVRRTRPGLTATFALVPFLLWVQGLQAQTPNPLPTGQDLQDPVLRVRFDYQGFRSESTPIQNLIPRRGYFLTRDYGIVYVEVTRPTLTPQRAGTDDFARFRIEVEQTYGFLVNVPENVRRQFQFSVYPLHSPVNEPGRRLWGVRGETTFSLGTVIDQGTLLSHDFSGEKRSITRRLQLEFVDSHVDSFYTFVYVDTALLMPGVLDWIHANYDSEVLTANVPADVRMTKLAELWTARTQPKIVPIAILYRPPGANSSSSMQTRSDMGTKMKITEARLESITTQQRFGFGPFSSASDVHTHSKGTTNEEHQLFRLTGSYALTTATDPAGQPGADDIMIALYRPTIYQYLNARDRGFLFGAGPTEQGTIISFKMKALWRADCDGDDYVRQLLPQEKQALLALNPRALNPRAALPASRFVWLRRESHAATADYVVEAALIRERVASAIQGQSVQSGGASDISIPILSTVSAASGVALPDVGDFGTFSVGSTNETVVRLDYRNDLSTSFGQAQVCSYHLEVAPGSTTTVDVYFDTLFRTIVVSEVVPQPRALWRGPNGEARIAAYASEGGAQERLQSAGPYSQYQPACYEKVLDDSARLVWRPVPGGTQISVWTLDKLDQYRSHRYLSQPAAWALSGYQHMQTDGSERFLFNLPQTYQSEARVRAIDPATNAVRWERWFTYAQGWQAASYQEDDDGSYWVLWSHSSGQGVLRGYDRYGWLRSEQILRGWMSGNVPASYKRMRNGTARVLWNHSWGSFVETMAANGQVTNRYWLSTWLGTGWVAQDFDMNLVPDAR